jgi:hypothetical protein
VLILLTMISAPCAAGGSGSSSTREPARQQDRPRRGARDGGEEAEAELDHAGLIEQQDGSEREHRNARDD